MRCQRCGFELEEGQTFCSMCGTEQSRAVRKKKWSPKSILWVIKVASKNHLKMWLVFIATLIMTICTVCVENPSPIMTSCICLDIVLVGYELFNVLLGYKNPNATKTKAYKIRCMACLILAILLLIATLWLDFADIATAIANSPWFGRRF